MNILLVNHISREEGNLQIGGVEYHRMMKPHYTLTKVFPETYTIEGIIMTHGVGEPIDEVLNQTDLVIFSRSIPDTAAEYLNNKGIPFGLDLDDYWHLPDHHIAYEDYLKEGKAEITVRSIREAHFVTCTTGILAEKIRPNNPNVYVVPNGIDTTDPVWQPNKSSSTRLRFGFTGGNTHHKDLELIAPSVRKSYQDIKFFSKAQVVYAGFRYTEPIVTPRGIDKSQIGVEQYCENILTDSLKVLKNKQAYRLELINNVPSQEKNAVYRRINAMPVNEFGSIYDDIDVCVAPLIDNEFNSCKSELKMLEAGFKDCAIMCHHVKPYTLLATDKNSFDLNKKSFYEWARILIQNPNLVSDTKSQLKEDIKKHDLKHLSEYRNEIYLKYKK